MTADTPAVPDEAVELAARAGSTILGLDFEDLDETDRAEALDYHRKVIAAALLAVGLPALLERVEAAEGMLDRTEAQIHDDDGFISQVVDQQQEISDLRHERDALAAKVERVEKVLHDGVEKHQGPNGDEFIALRNGGALSVLSALRAALTEAER